MNRGGAPPGSGSRRRTPALNQFPAEDDVTPVPVDVPINASNAWAHATRLHTRNAERISSVNQLIIAHAADVNASVDELRRRTQNLELALNELSKELNHADKAIALLQSNTDRILLQLGGINERITHLISDTQERQNAASHNDSNWRRLLVQIVPTTIAAAMAVAAFAANRC